MDGEAVSNRLPSKPTEKSAETAVTGERDVEKVGEEKTGESAGESGGDANVC
jgi:hypothetical protein